LRGRFFYLFGVVSAFIIVLAADFRYLSAPNDTFGLAGILWLAGIGLLLCCAFIGSKAGIVPISYLSRRG
jgi:hypothetical protein